MKKHTFLFYFIALAIVAIFQPTLMNGIEIFGVSPDLFIVFTVCSAMLRGGSNGAVCGFVFGLVLDMLTGRLIGINAVLYMYAGFLTGILNERYISTESSFANAVFVFASSLVCGVLYFTVYNGAWSDIRFFTAFLRTILPKAVYSAVVGFVLFVPLKKCFGLIEVKRLF